MAGLVRSAVRHADRQRRIVPRQDRSRLSPRSVRAESRDGLHRGDERHWLVDRPAEIVACAADTAIHVHTGSGASLRTVLHGHDGDVRALAHDSATHTLYSAGDDGTVRTWDLAHLPEAVDAVEQAYRISAWNGRIAALHSDGRRLLARVLDADGNPVGPSVTFPTESQQQDEAPRGRLVLAATIVARELLLLVERRDCGPFDCEPGTPRRAIMVDHRSGDTLAEVDDLAAGPFLGAMPAAIALDTRGSGSPKPRTHEPVMDA